MLNIAQGGSLYQEAGEVLEDFLPSKSIISKWIGRRNVAVKEGSHLFDILGGFKQYFVNSIHHQAVNEVGAGFEVVAREENDLVQAIEQSKDQHPYAIGVQWHPELMLHARSARRLFHAHIRAAAS